MQDFVADAYAYAHLKAIADTADAKLLLDQVNAKNDDFIISLDQGQQGTHFIEKLASRYWERNID